MMSISRRDFLANALAVAAASRLSLSSAFAQQESRPKVKSNAAAHPKIESDEDVERLLPQITNWGKWGNDDQLGTLNYITEEKRKAAARLVKSGQTISLAREVSLTKTEGIRRAQHEVEVGEQSCRDFIGMVYHGFAMTHLDGLCHIFAGDKLYNGFAKAEVTPAGANKLGAENMARQGMVGRGVLLDIGALKDGALKPGTAISPADLDAAEKRQRVEVGEGDILFIRTGAGAKNTREKRAGLHPSCLPWLHERKIALLGSDGDSDVAPVAGFSRWASAMHAIAIPYMGLPLIDNAELDVLSKACVDAGRWQFLCTVNPLRITGMTGSPVNPVALL